MQPIARHMRPGVLPRRIGLSWCAPIQFSLGSTFSLSNRASGVEVSSNRRSGNGLVSSKMGGMGCVSWEAVCYK